MLAYAISIHKAQGMTIPKLEVSFNGVFEYGQGYVAISRATDLEGLFLTSFNPTLVKAHPEVSYIHLSSFSDPSLNR
jgi:ATP-dependent DNA helicase PIF1